MVHSLGKKHRSRIVLYASLGIFMVPAPARAKNPPACGAGVSLKLSSPGSSQGSLLLVEVHSRMPIAELAGKWDDRSVGFWSLVTGQKSGSADLRRGLLGVDLEKPPGSYKFSVDVQTASGKRVGCVLNILVRRGKFAIEKLHVDKQFVEPCGARDKHERAFIDGRLDLQDLPQARGGHLHVR